MKVYVESIQPIIDEVHLKISKHENIQKYIDKGYSPKFPPFRNMIEVFTFGQIVKMYKYLSNTYLKKTISRKYGLDEEKFQNWLKITVDVRNLCCHHNKLFSKRDWKIAHVKVLDSKVNGNFDTLYHVCCVIFYLLSYINPHNNFKDSLQDLLDRYPGVLSSFPDGRQSQW